MRTDFIAKCYEIKMINGMAKTIQANCAILSIQYQTTWVKLSSNKCKGSTIFNITGMPSIACFIVNKNSRQFNKNLHLNYLLVDACILTFRTQLYEKLNTF